MCRALKFSWLLLLGLTVNAGSVWAQFGGSGGGMGGGGMGGGGMGGGGSSGSGMFGTNRTTGTGNSSSGFGSSSNSTGLNAFGQNSPLQMSQNVGLGQNSTGQNSGGFVGTTAQQASRNFVGVSSQATNQQGAYGSGSYGSNSALGMGGMSGMSGMSGLGGSSMLGMGGMGGMSGYGGNRMGQNGQYGGMGGYGGGASPNGSNAPTVRTRLTLPAEIAVPSIRAGSTIAGHLSSLPALHWSSAPKVDLQGHTAVLRGVVATEHDRDLAERIVRLEPTVSEVQNQLVVAGSGQGTSEATPMFPPAGQSATPGSTPATH
jgi:hypothetical protein